MSQQRLTLVCHLEQHVGYGLHAAAMVRELGKLGVHVAIRALTQDETLALIPLELKKHVVLGPQPEEWELVLSTPTFKPTPGKKTAYFSMNESTELAGWAVANLNLAEIVIVPSEWCRETFIRSGVTVPVLVVPLGCDFRLPIGDLRLSESKLANLKSQIPPTRFACAGRTAHGRERKGLDAVIRCFRAAFPYDQNVRLALKCYPDCKLMEFEDSRISVTREHLKESHIAGWLWIQDCFVSAACGEGFGLWQLQAMAMGLPLICAAYGGLREFVGPHNAYLVHYREVPSAEHFGGRWCQPDLGTMVSQMRYVHEHREEAAKLGAFAAETVQGFTWENSARQLVQVLALAGALTAERAAFSKPVIHQLNYDPPAQPDLFAQATEQGFNLEELHFQKRKDEAIFNPSVVLWEGKPLWFGRSSGTTGGDRPDSRIFAFLEPAEAGTPNALPVGQRIPIHLPRLHGDALEDPRAILTPDGLALGYVRVSPPHPACQELAVLDAEFRVKDVLHVDYQGNGRSSTSVRKTQKNWVWFQYQGDWHVIYWLEPMRVLHLRGGAVAREYRTDKFYPGWQWGVRHGGGSPTLVGEEWFGFTHSLMPWYTQSRSRYYLSAYAFQNEPPFALTRLSRKPFLASVDDVRTNPCSCVITGGAVYQQDESDVKNGKNGTWTLAVGARDEMALKLTMSHEWLLNTMEIL